MGRVLVHLSDLHFGAAHSWIAERLMSNLRSQPPDLVVITGDLTQRARTRQFRAAHEFLARLNVPYVVTPGNHDVAPLYHPLRRLFAPFERYRRYVSPYLDSYYVDEQLLVVGLNSADPWRLVEGSIQRAQLDWLWETTQRYTGRLTILASHHPLVAASGPGHHRHGKLLPRLERSGVRVCLSGHLHRSHCGPNTDLLAQGRLLVIHACTATSSRLRGQANAYNRIELEREELQLDVCALNGAHFQRQNRARFSWRAEAWHEACRVVS